MNKAILIGRLTKDPELSTTNSGVSVCRFTLAVDRQFKNSDGERQADFLPVVAWRQQAEFVQKWFQKGSPCAVVGSIQTRSYDAQDGTKRYVTEIVADSVEFVPKSQGASGGDYSEEREVKPKKSMDELQEINDDDLPF